MQHIRKILIKLISLLGLQNIIILEAEYSKRENTEAVYREILRRPWSKKFRFVLISMAPEKLASEKRRHTTVIKYLQYDDSKWAKLRYFWYRLRAVMIIDENRQIQKRNPSTIHVFLTHGSPVKNVRAYYNATPDTDYVLNQSDYWRSINSYQLKVSPDKLVTLGFPRNDVLFSVGADPARLFGRAYRKYVIWYPTYRQHKGSGKNQRFTGAFSIPVIHDREAACKVNAIASKYDVLLLVKPHPAQDVSLIQALELDHLRVINDDFFLEHQTTDYAFIASSDAMITDYSSVVMDYLLTRKPIALTLEDYPLYEAEIGFAIDMNLLRSCATELNSPEDFDAFLRDLVEGTDPLRERRTELMQLTNRYTDGGSTKRVVDWLASLLRY